MSGNAIVLLTGEPSPFSRHGFATSRIVLRQQTPAIGEENPRPGAGRAMRALSWCQLSGELRPASVIHALMTSVAVRVDVGARRDGTFAPATAFTGQTSFKMDRLGEWKLAGRGGEGEHLQPHRGLGGKIII